MSSEPEQVRRLDPSVRDWWRQLEVAGPPKPLEDYRALAHALLLAGDRRGAVSALEAGLAYRHDVLDGPNNAALDLQAAGRFDEAADAFRFADAHVHPVFDLYMVLGRTLRAQGDLAGAIHAFREASVLKPGDAELKAVVCELAPSDPDGLKKARAARMKTWIVPLMGVMLVVVLHAGAALASPASSAAKAAARGLTRKVWIKPPVAAQGVAVAAKTADAAALRRVLSDLDQKTLAKIETRFGQHIPAERLGQAAMTRTKFLPHETYQAHLSRRYPSLSAEERRRVVGDYLGRPYADRNQVFLPRTVAHERLHQLRASAARGQLGARLDEGITEHLASRIYGDVSIKGLPTGYPSERRIAGMLASRVGDDALARAYFRGDVSALRQGLDRQLGKGSFDAISQLTGGGRYAEAETVLKRGLVSR